MKSLILKLLLFSFGIIVYGCLPDPIDVDVQEMEKKMVVASQIIPNQVMVVAVTHSFSPLTGFGTGLNGNPNQDFISQLLVPDAIVKVKHPNGESNLTMVTPGIYMSVDILQEAYGAYELSVKNPTTGQEITAKTTLLPTVPFNSATPIVKSINDTLNEVYIKYELTDIPNKNNYYVLSYYTLKNGQLPGSIPIGTGTLMGENSANYELISDNIAVNGKIEQEVFLPSINVGDTIAISVSNITQEYFEFLSARKRSGNLFTMLTGEAITYPTNVVNGYGFFNVTFPDVRVIIMNKNNKYIFSK